MNRRVWVLVVSFAALLFGGVIAALLLSKSNNPINPENYARISLGMTQQGIIDILGSDAPNRGPGRSGRLQDHQRIAELKDDPHQLPVGCHRITWQGDEWAISAVVNQNQLVIAHSLVRLDRDGPSWISGFRRLLRMNKVHVGDK